jgi:protein-disulfide isomerase
MPADALDLKKGITKDGHPWIGAERPELIITEFADYLCFQCQKNHHFLRRLTAKYPQKIRLVHRHFPMDSRVNPIVKVPFHEGAAQLAVLANYALSQNKFWEMNDILYKEGKKQTISLKALADQTGLDLEGLSTAIHNQRLIHQLFRDINDGVKLGIRGTPAYVIDDRVYIGQIPPEIIKTVLE